MDPKTYSQINFLLVSIIKSIAVIRRLPSRIDIICSFDTASFSNQRTAPKIILKNVVLIFSAVVLLLICALCSQNGKKLISRCRTLIAENQELGRQLSQGKSAQLEAELALQKKYSDELKVSQDGKSYLNSQLEILVTDLAG